MTVYAITDTKKGRTGIAPTYLHTTQRSTFSIHFYNAGAPTFGGLSPPKPPPQTPLMGFTRNKRALTSHGFATQSGNGINDMQILSTVSCCRTFETVVSVTLQTLWNVLHDCP